MTSTHVAVLADAVRDCLTYSKPMTWPELPSEIVVMILEKLPISQRAAMSRVCRTWRAVIHSEVSRTLNKIIRANLVEESQLSSLETDISDQNHDISTCICIGLVYNKTPFSLCTRKGKGIEAGT